MTGGIRLCTILVACALVVAPASAQVTSSDSLSAWQASGPGRDNQQRHHASRMERRGRHLQWRWERMEGWSGRWHRGGRWASRHAHPMRARSWTGTGRRWERHRDRMRRGTRLEERGMRLRRAWRRDRRHQRPDGMI